MKEGFAFNEKNSKWSVILAVLLGILNIVYIVGFNRVHRGICQVDKLFFSTVPGSQSLHPRLCLLSDQNPLLHVWLAVIRDQRSYNTQIEKETEKKYCIININVFTVTNFKYNRNGIQEIKCSWTFSELTECSMTYCKIHWILNWKRKTNWDTFVLLLSCMVLEKLSHPFTEVLNK